MGMDGDSMSALVFDAMTPFSRETPSNRVVKEADCRHSYATKTTILRRGDCYGEEVSRFDGDNICSSFP